MYKQYQNFMTNCFVEAILSNSSRLTGDIFQPGYFGRQYTNHCAIEFFNLGEKNQQTRCSVYLQRWSTLENHSDRFDPKLGFQAKVWKSCTVKRRSHCIHQKSPKSATSAFAGLLDLSLKAQYFLSALGSCLDRPYDYIVIDLRQSTNEKYRLRTAILGKSL